MRVQSFVGDGPSYSVPTFKFHDCSGLFKSLGIYQSHLPAWRTVFSWRGHTSCVGFAYVPSGPSYLLSHTSKHNPRWIDCAEMPWYQSLERIETRGGKSLHNKHTSQHSWASKSTPHKYTYCKEYVEVPCPIKTILMFGVILEWLVCVAFDVYCVSF